MVSGVILLAAPHCALGQGFARHIHNIEVALPVKAGSIPWQFTEGRLKQKVFACYLALLHMNDVSTNGRQQIRIISSLWKSTIHRHFVVETEFQHTGRQNNRLELFIALKIGVSTPSI